MQRIAQKLKHITLLCVMSTTTYAAGISQQVKPNNVHLDQSQNILFEQFSPSTYTLQLLQAKNKFNNKDLIFGGLVEGDIQRWQGDTINLTPPGVYEQGNGIYLTQVTLDAMNNFNPWSTFFLSIADSHIGRPGSNGNYIYFQHAFVALGNVDTFPLYATIGINTVPFGIFTGSGSVDTPLTAAYFDPIQSPQVSLGYFKNGLNFSATGYSDPVNHDNNFAYSFYYAKAINNFSYSVGAGYITDLKTTGAGNPTVVNTQRDIVRNAKGKTVTRIVNELGLAGTDMGAVQDFNASIAYKQIALSGEYLRGNSTLQPNQNKPRAFAVSAIYTAKIAGKDTPFGISYSRAFNFKNVPVSLPGSNTILLTNAGLQSNLAFSVTRPMLTKTTFIGISLQNTTTFFEHHTYTATLDVTTYI